MPREQLMRAHRATLSQCKKCPEMIGPVVSGSPVLSKILLIGQAPGDKEGGFGKLDSRQNAVQMVRAYRA